MYYVIVDEAGKILTDGLGRPYRTDDPGLRDGYRQRAEELGAKLLEIDSTVWPPAERYVVDEAAGTIQSIDKPHPDATWSVDHWVIPRSVLESQAVQSIRAEFRRRMLPITSAYPDETQKTFERQLAEAKEVQDGSPSATPFIDAKAAATGRSRTDLAKAIIAKADIYAQICGATDGRRDALEAAVPGLSDADLAAYDATARWDV